MPSYSTASRPLPAWLMVLGSLFASGHLLVILLLALAPQSGPWPVPTPMGFRPFPADGPSFASMVTMQVTVPCYLQPLRMISDYHFQSNRVAVPAYRFEVQLRDGSGDVFKVLKFPDEKANPWVRHRQGLLAFALGDDTPVEISPTEPVAAPGREEEKFKLWVEQPKGKSEGFNVIVQHQAWVGRKNKPNAPMSPSDATKILVEAYGRHLCRQYGAKSAELIRIHRPVIMPMELFQPNGPTPEAFVEIHSYFGDTREK
jgi:hypothetical protein